MNGLVLTAGGARGAYQAGVLKRIGELRSIGSGRSPFPIVSGASAGAINGALVACGSDDFGEATRQIASVWSSLTVEQVFRTDAAALGRTAAAWARDLAFGGMLGGGTISHLLDASPLRDLLERQLHLERLPGLIARGDLYALAISATSYHSGRAFTFIHGRPGHPTWHKSRRVCLSVPITVDHVRASASIPLIFPPVHIRTQRGETYFGDGAMRLTTPLHPAIRLGAGHVLAIGVRCSSSASELADNELEGTRSDDRIKRPPLSQICGVFLNAIFLDHLDTDLDHLDRLNELAAAHVATTHHDLPDSATAREPIRRLERLLVSPSEDLALVAESFAHRMPAVIRYVMEGLGPPDAKSADLMSYLLFDGAFTRALVEIGYEDAGERIDELEAFLCAGMDEVRVSNSPAAS